MAEAGAGIVVADIAGVATGSGAGGSIGGTTKVGGANGLGSGTAAGRVGSTGGAGEMAETGPSSSKSAVVRGKSVLSSSTKRCKG